MSLSTFGVFLLVGSDSAVKVRGGCQEARHRDWIQCLRGNIHGSTSYKQFYGVNVGYPVVGSYHAPIDPLSEQNPIIREDLMKRYPAEPTDVHVLFRKDEASPPAPVFLQMHANAGTEFDYVTLEKYEQVSDDRNELLYGYRRRPRVRSTSEPRSFIQRYLFADVTIAEAGQDRDVFGMRFNFQRMFEYTLDLPK